jgi:hypothetical protein
VWYRSHTQPVAGEAIRAREPALVDELHTRDDCKVVIPPQPIRFDPVGMFADGCERTDAA